MENVECCLKKQGQYFVSDHFFVEGLTEQNGVLEFGFAHRKDVYFVGFCVDEVFETQFEHVFFMGIQGAEKAAVLHAVEAGLFASFGHFIAGAIIFDVV